MSDKPTILYTKEIKDSGREWLNSDPSLHGMVAYHNSGEYNAKNVINTGSKKEYCNITSSFDGGLYISDCSRKVSLDFYLYFSGNSLSDGNVESFEADYLEHQIECEDKLQKLDKIIFACQKLKKGIVTHRKNVDKLYNIFHEESSS